MTQTSIDLDLNKEKQNTLPKTSSLFPDTRPEAEAVLIGIGPTEPIPHKVDWSYNGDTFPLSIPKR